MSFDDGFFDGGQGNDSMDDLFGFENSSGTNSSAGTSKNSAKKKKKKKEGAGIKILIGIAIVAAVFLAVSFIRSPGRGACKELILDLQTDLNNKNVKGIINLLVPQYSLPLSGAILVGEMVTDADLNKAFSDIMGYIGSGNSSEIAIDSTNVSEMMDSIELKPVRYGLPGATRKVKCRATFSLNGVELRHYLNIYIQKIHGDCYLKKIRLTR